MSNSDEELDPPPTSEDEEIERRAFIPIAALIVWYKLHGKSLDVPLRDYVTSERRRYGEHS